MRFLDCFLKDALPGPDGARYDCEGPAVWLVDGKPHFGKYGRSQVLPLYDLTEQQLEDLASVIVSTWGDPHADPVYNARWAHFEGRSNLLLYQIRKRPDM
jgi:hypothetical protein